YNVSCSNEMLMSLRNEEDVIGEVDQDVAGDGVVMEE
ncbi:unnamed protein product, partial [Rotaria sp. Silwood1]